MKQLIKKYKVYVNAGYGIVQIREMTKEKENIPDNAIDAILAELFKSKDAKKG